MPDPVDGKAGDGWSNDVSGGESEQHRSQYRGGAGEHRAPHANAVDITPPAYGEQHGHDRQQRHYQADRERRSAELQRKQRQRYAGTGKRQVQQNGEQRDEMEGHLNGGKQRSGYGSTPGRAAGAATTSATPKQVMNMPMMLRSVGTTPNSNSSSTMYCMHQQSSHYHVAEFRTRGGPARPDDQPIGIRHRMPKVNRSERNVKGAACSNPILVARKPESQTLTKYHAKTESNQRWPDIFGVKLRWPQEKNVSIP